MERLTIDQLSNKWGDIENKIPSIWKSYEEAGIELAQDLCFTWDVEEYELIRVISLVSCRVSGLDLTKHINPLFSYMGLYPEIMKPFNIIN